MRRLFATPDSVEAHHARELLLQHGIEAVVHGEALTLLRGGRLPATAGGALSVWVLPEDYDAAVEVLARVEEQAAAAQQEDQPWQCSGCGEWHHAQFTDCWRCGTDRDAEAAEPLPVLPFDGRLEYESPVGDEHIEEPDDQDLAEGSLPSFVCAECGHQQESELLHRCPRCGAEQRDDWD